MIAVSFIFRILTVLKILPRARKFNQDFLCPPVLSGLIQEKDKLSREISVNFHSPYGSHNRQRTIEQLAHTKITPFLYPAYFSGLTLFHG
jgi:hypothetical protein